MPPLRACLAAAARDLYLNSWRFAAANTLWGACVLALAGLAVYGSAAWLAAAPLLALPFGGLVAMACTVVRGQPLSLSDLPHLARATAGRALMLGLIALCAAAVLTTNLLAGLGLGSLLGLLLALAALPGLVGLGVLLVVWWPLVCDPDAAGLRRQLALGAALALAAPGRTLALSVLVLFFTALSAALVVGLLTIGLSYIALLCAHAVLPGADALATRAGEVRAAARRAEVDGVAGT